MKIKDLDNNDFDKYCCLPMLRLSQSNLLLVFPDRVSIMENKKNRYFIFIGDIFQCPFCHKKFEIEENENEN